MGIRITKKAVVPTMTPADAFNAQRQQEAGSYRLREAVKAMLNEGKAHTSTVAKVFALLVQDSGDRFSAADIQRVLPGFDVEKTW